MNDKEDFLASRDRIHSKASVCATRRRVAWGLAIVLLCTGWTLRGRSQAITKSGVTRINLRKFGWQPPPRISPGEGTWTSQQIAIDHKGRVLVCFPVREPVGGVPHRSDAELALRILRFTRNGKTDLSLDLPTDNWTGYGVYLDATDDIVARADEKIQMLVRSGGARTKQDVWKTLATCRSRGCEVRQSPSHRTLYLDDTAHIGGNVTILTGNHLSDVRVCAAPGLPAHSFTDTFAYYSNDRPSTTPPFRWYDFTDRWPLCDYSQRTELPIAQSLTPISDHALLANINKRYVVYGADGEVKNSFPLRLAKHETGGLVWPAEEGISENGERIAPIIYTQRGGNSWLDISPHLTAQRVIVYEVATGRQLASIPVPHPTYFLVRVIGPDGRRVAFLVNGTLTIADAP